MARVKQKDEQELALLPGAALRGLIAGIIASASLWLILTAVSLSMEDPLRLLTAFSLAALFVGALTAGIAAGCRDRGNAPFAGFIAGTLYVLLLWLISLFFRGGAGTGSASPLFTAIGYGVCIVLALAGGIVSRPKPMSRSGKNPAASARRRASSRH